MGRVASGLSVAVLLLATALPSSTTCADSPELRVLFVGNSYTRHNDMPGLVTSLSAAGGVTVETDLAFVAGATLRDQWRRRTALGLLARGGFTHVVLQGHSLDPLERPEELAEYVRRFNQAADAAGATTILYETWPRHPESPLYRRGVVASSPEEMMGRIARVYGDLGRSLGTPVAPVGRAFFNATSEAPGIRLYWPDGSHPTTRGTYLAACILYGVLTGGDPAAVAHHPRQLPEGAARELRRIASRTLADRPPPPPP